MPRGVSIRIDPICTVFANYTSSSLMIVFKKISLADKNNLQLLMWRFVHTSCEVKEKPRPVYHCHFTAFNKVKRSVADPHDIMYHDFFLFAYSTKQRAVGFFYAIFVASIWYLFAHCALIFCISSKQCIALF